METVKIKHTVASKQKVLIINISNKDSFGVYNPLCKNESTPNYIYSENNTLLKFIHKILLDKDYCCTLIEGNIFPLKGYSFEGRIFPPKGYSFTLESSDAPDRENIAMYKEVISYSIEK
mgnify:CR=1 FL=1